MTVYAIISPNDGKKLYFSFLIKTNYRFRLISTHQSQTIQLTDMLGSRRKQINPGGVDALSLIHISEPTRRV